MLCWSEIQSWGSPGDPAPPSSRPTLTVSHLRSPGLLGSLDDGVLNSLGLTAWGYPRQPPLPPNILLPFRGELSKMPCLEEKAPLETQASLTQLCSPQSTGRGQWSWASLLQRPKLPSLQSTRSNSGVL